MPYHAQLKQKCVYHFNMTHPIRELTVALFIFLFIFYLLLLLSLLLLLLLLSLLLLLLLLLLLSSSSLFYMSVFIINDSDVNQCFHLFSSIYAQQSKTLIQAF